MRLRVVPSRVTQRPGFVSRADCFDFDVYPLWSGLTDVEGRPVPRAVEAFGQAKQARALAEIGTPRERRPAGVHESWGVDTAEQQKANHEPTPMQESYLRLS